MEKLIITVENRKEKNPKELRKSGYVPGVIYNHGKTDHIQIEKARLKNLFGEGVTESTLIDLKIDKKEDQPVFIKDYQKHPLTEEILHIDFFRVTFGERIRTHIPIELIGKPIGVKEGGVLETFIHSIEIETYPRHLVASLQVDISELNIDDSVHVLDIKLPPESKILMDGNPGVCQVSTSAKLESQITPEDKETQEDIVEEEEADRDTKKEKTKADKDSKKRKE